MKNPPATIPSENSTPAVARPTETAPQRMARRQKNYTAMKEAILCAVPATIIMLKDKSGNEKPFLTKEFWMHIAREMGIQVHLETDVDVTIRDIDTVKVIYRATLGTASSVGDGACDFEEPGITKTYHNVRSRAHTRGMVRAIRALVGFGERSMDVVDARGYTGDEG